MADAPGRYHSFDAVADDYDRTRVIPDAQMNEIARILARESQLERGGLFLDAGVGTGRFAAPLARRLPGQVIGVDIAAAMMQRVRGKEPLGKLPLAQGDLQRLPFRNNVFTGALLVHILHLIERWTVVVAEIRRVLTPKRGVLFLGSEQGGRSLMVDFYYERARARHVLASSLGVGGVPQTLAYLRRVERDGGAGAQVSLLEAPQLSWKRVVPVDATLDALALRTYSQMWNIPDVVHQELLAETRAYARQTFHKLTATETLSSRFVLHKVSWP